MQKLILNLQYCYGIKKLDIEFDFSSQKTFSIYAPNGVMKTSFAKTFKDLSNNQESKDLIFTDRETVRIIKDENGISILPEEIFVVEPYNEQFNSNKISTLVVKKELKGEYDEIYKDLEVEKIEFIKKLKKISQSTDCEAEFIATFKENEKDTFFDVLNKIEPLLTDALPEYNFKYNDIFDKKGTVKNFLEKHNDSLDLYIEKYESIISGSNFFKKSSNTFGTHQANEVLKSIKDGSFFSAGHSLELSDKTKVNSIDVYEKIIEDEIKKVVDDKDLKKIFDQIDSAIGANTELRAFKGAIERNNLLLVELKSYNDFKAKVWLSFFFQLKNDLLVLLESYISRKEKLQAIIGEALNTKTDWEKAIEEFNKRFKGLPFSLKIQNKEDVILKTIAPSIEFVFRDAGEEKSIERKDLLEVLSQGERRALYILNIIFEIEARKKINQKTLFIIDDIADSFDYKNKYAIIEYLKDISKEDIFYQIILSHNFDFFRCIEGRFVGRSHCKIVIKTSNKICIEPAGYFNPFRYFKKNLSTNDKILIASIPFVRNLAEYSGYNTEFEKLTSLLHIKSGTNAYAISDLEDIFKIILVDQSDLRLPNGTKKVIDLIFELAEEISQNTIEEIQLENKVVLSIAIRLRAEQFMIQKISDQNFVSQIEKHQTIMLIEKYKELFQRELENIELLEQVNLMTPENIHFNSFMYEPILDMSNDHLRDLYKKISSLSLK